MDGEEAAMTDLALAIAHHVAVFGLVMMLALERGLLSAPRLDIGRLARIDAGYGACAVLVLGIGAARVFLGARGWAFYADNPAFWLKMAAFALAGVASAPPTIAIQRWRKALRFDPAYQPDAAAVAAARHWTGWQLLLVFVIVAAAATMARWPLF
jgi:putative membrane protein